MKKITLLLSLFLASIFATLQSQSIATYDIVFTSTWNASEHTNAMDMSLPGNAHWSKLVGVNHNSDVDFFEVGQMATLGVELIAENGTNDVFRDTDVQNAIDALDAQQYINGPSLSTAAGTITITGLEVNQDFPLLTLLSMVAPSPDWYIGLDGLNLLDASGNWKTSITIPMTFVYDAGTDSGSNYTSGNNDANLPISIFDMSNTIEPFNGNDIGFIEITLTNVLSVEDLNSIDAIKLFPNPSQGKVTITNTRDLETVEVYNILGRLVTRIQVQQNPTLELHLSHLSKGLYVVKMTDINTNTKTQKLILE
ncbi:spondin domain-containing protein [Lacinutrix iliipiscaria]|uniref:Spondin domain-containing protein n=1 Tax=Lacinutrix iliipiscaria TaxID=1230532 RepID=A0ABW5WMM2_9FLAO